MFCDLDLLLQIFIYYDVLDYSYLMLPNGSNMLSIVANLLRLFLGTHHLNNLVLSYLESLFKFYF